MVGKEFELPVEPAGFEVVDLAMRPEMTTLRKGTGDHHAVEKRGDEGQRIA
jgi:hypothetical protein